MTKEINEQMAIQSFTYHLLPRYNRGYHVKNAHMRSQSHLSNLIWSYFLLCEGWCHRIYLDETSVQTGHAQTKLVVFGNNGVCCLWCALRLLPMTFYRLDIQTSLYNRLCSAHLHDSRATFVLPLPTVLATSCHQHAGWYGYITLRGHGSGQSW